jgi:hypothetical protein
MRQSVRGVRNLDGLPDGHSGNVRQCLRQDRSCSRMGGWGGHVGGRTLTKAPHVRWPWPAGAAVLDLRPGRAPHEPPWPRGYRRGPPVSTLVTGVRSAAGHPSGASDRRRHRHGPRHQPGHVCRTPAVRRAVVPKAADGQSADRSLQLSPLSSRPALRAGRLRRPSSRRQRHGAHRRDGLTAHNRCIRSSHRHAAQYYSRSFQYLPLWDAAWVAAPSLPGFPSSFVSVGTAVMGPPSGST